MKEIYKKRIKKYIEEEAKSNGVSIEEEKEIIKENWGKGGLHGYGIFESDDVVAEHIEKIDDMGIFDNDMDAGEQAEQDGIKLIPIESVPNVYPYNCYRFIDTPANREIIKQIELKECNI